MRNFISYKDSIEMILSKIISCDENHAKWLNTLSYLENCGSRKIALCQHPTLVKKEMLKHAAEEARHAHYLKSQISKLGASLENYSKPYLLGGIVSEQYLKKLDIRTCKYLNSLGFNRSKMTELAYLLVTFAIEKRALELYQVYDEMLNLHSSKVKVKSIFLEELDHLSEMSFKIDALTNGHVYRETVCKLESQLFKKWLDALKFI